MPSSSTLVRTARFFSCFAVLCALVGGPPSQAATFEWQEGLFSAGGFHDDPNRWGLVSGSGSPPPDVGDTAEFNLADDYGVIIETGANPQTWELDKILVTNGVVTINARHSQDFVESTFLNLTTGDADIEVDGGHLILAEQTAGFDDSFTVTVGDDFIIREGIAELRSNTTLTTPDMILGRENGKTSEVRIADGATLNVTAGFTNFIGLNAGQGILSIAEGKVTLAGTTNLGVSSSALSSGVINVSSIDSPIADTLLTLDSLVLGGDAGTGTLTASVRSETQLTGASTLTIGGSGGAGTINVQDDALFDTGTGNITLNSTGELNLSGGTFQADGFLDFQGGTLNVSGGELVINDGMDAVAGGGELNLTGGTVRVAGGLARLETSLNFGGGPTFDERAEVIVEGGSMAEVQFAVRIASQANTVGRVVVSGAGSSLVGTGGGAGADLIVGDAGDGYLEVSDGGLASFRDDFVVAEEVGATGDALVRRDATVDVTAGSGAVVSIAPSGTGVLTIWDGGLVQAGSDVFLASQVTGHATVVVEEGFCPLGNCSTSDATLQSGDDLFVGGGSTTAGGTAMLTVDDGGRVVVPNLMRVYGGGSVQFDGGRIEVGALEFQGGGSWVFGTSAIPGTLHFTGDETFDAPLIAGLSGTTRTHNRGMIELVGALTVTAPFTIAGGDLTAAALNANAAITIDDSFSPSTDMIITGIANVSSQFTQHNSNVTIDDLALSAPYVLTGGKLSLRTGSGLPRHFDFQGGLLELTAAELTVGPGGLLGDLIDFGAGRTVENLGETVVASGGLLQTSGGVYEATGAVTVQNGGTINNESTLRVRHDLIVEAGGRFFNSGTTTLLSPAGNSISGRIDNQTTLVLDTAEVIVPASGLTLDGGGEVIANINAVINGNSVAVINNVDNHLAGNSTNRLELRNLALQMGATAVVGSGVDLVGVDMVGGTIDTSAGAQTVLSSSTTLDGVIDIISDVSILGARVLPSGEVRLQSVSQFTVSPATLDLDGRLRAEAGAVINLPAAGTYDWSDGTVSLADDTTHTVDPGATVVLTTPLAFDNLTVDNSSFGFLHAVFGAEPVIAPGQALQVGGTTTLDSILTIDGGTFVTSSLVNYEQLDLRSGEFHLTGDDLLVEPGGAGPIFSVGAAATLTVDHQIETAIGSRLLVAGGAASGATLSNGGDLDLIEGSASFSGAADNTCDINAIDSVLTFDGGLNNTGQLNLINTTVNGPVVNSGTASLAGTNTFAGDVSGSGDFTGGGTAVFEGTFAPGESPGEIAFGGDVVFGTLATLEIGIGGTVPGTEFDALDIAGAATLAGALDVALISVGGGEFAPSNGDTFEILTAAGGVSGSFLTSAAKLPALSDHLAWEINYGADDVTLAVVPALPGDFNLDGVVDAADYTVWRDTLGSIGDLRADGDGSDTIDQGDFDVWKMHFGLTAAALRGPSSSTPAAVPEPATAVLLLIVTCLAHLMLAGRGA